MHVLWGLSVLSIYGLALTRVCRPCCRHVGWAWAGVAGCGARACSSTSLYEPHNLFVLPEGRDIRSLVHLFSKSPAK